MATLIDAPEFTANEVYEEQQTDACEGAGVGAHFNGLGNNNQPHQQLANRTAFLKNQQAINIANIAVLQAFQALFTGTLVPNEGSSIIRIPFLDSAKGLIDLIIQFGQYIYDGTGSDQTVSVGWPAAFPNAFAMAFAVALRPPGAISNDGNDWGIKFIAGSGSNTGAEFFIDRYNGTGQMYGFNWFAIGY